MNAADTLAPMRIPDDVNLFPDHAKKFPCYGIKNSLFVLLGNYPETLDKSSPFRLLIPFHFLKFPVFFPVTGNFPCGEGFESDCVIRHPVFAFRDSLLRSPQIHANRPNLHLLRHQRLANSSHTVRFFAFYLCFEFSWCREKTGHKSSQQWLHPRTDHHRSLMMARCLRAKLFAGGVNLC